MTIDVDRGVGPRMIETIAIPQASEQDADPIRWGRREDRRLLLGEALFTGDVHRPGQLWLGVVRSPVASGRITKVHTDEGSRLPGVHAVLTARDCAPVPRIPIRVHARTGMERFLQPVLADGVVRYVGEPVAVVVADDPYLAEDACDLVEVEVEPDEPFLRPWPDVEPDAISERVVRQVTARNGDLDGAFSRADVVVQAELTVGRQTGLPMETRGLVAEWRDEALHVWGPTKFLRFTRSTLATLFSIAESAVHLHRVDVGGMFGTRGEFYPEDFLVPWAAQVVGRPVMWVEDRREHLMAANHSREQRHRCAVAVGADGELLGLRDEVVVDMGAYARPIGARMVEIAAQTLPGPYRWGAFAVSAQGVATNKTPIGTMRGPGSFETTFVRERMLDMAAAKLDMDPLELRRRNLIRGAELPFEQSMGDELDAVHLDAGDYHETLDELLALGRYRELCGEVERRRAGGELVGVSVACFVEHSGLGGEESAELSVRDDGSFLLRTSTTEVGQGLAGTLATIAAETLDVAVERIVVRTADSEMDTLGFGTFSSRSTIFAGSATRDACEALLREARARASRELDCAPDDIEIGPDGLAAGSGLLRWADLGPIDVVGRHVMRHPTYGFGAVLALVSVDGETGSVRPERLVVGFDAGRVINPAGATAQLKGAAIMGVGGALFEELVYADNGEPISVTFMDYLVPSSAERPRVEAHALETRPVPGNPLGVRGVGEAGIVAVGAAVAGAVASALDRVGDPVLTELPIKPHVVGQLVAVPWLADVGVEPSMPTSAGGLGSRRARALAAGVCGLVAAAIALAAWRSRRETT